MRKKMKQIEGLEKSNNKLWKVKEKISMNNIFIYHHKSRQILWIFDDECRYEEDNTKANKNKEEIVTKLVQISLNIQKIFSKKILMGRQK